jgi:hypothetical protein
MATAPARTKSPSTTTTIFKKRFPDFPAGGGAEPGCKVGEGGRVGESVSDAESDSVAGGPPAAVPHFAQKAAWSPSSVPQLMQKRAIDHPNVLPCSHGIPQPHECCPVGRCFQFLLPDRVRQRPCDSCPYHTQAQVTARWNCLLWARRYRHPDPGASTWSA